MFTLSNSKKFFLFFGVLSIAAGCWLINTGTLTAQQEKPITNEVDLRTAFVKVADIVGPAVVSISAEKVRKAPGVKRYYFGPKGPRGPKGQNPFGEDFFDDFFKDFFGDIPEREYRQMGLGTGVIVDSEGYILTNEHVISGAEKITVTLPDGRIFKGKIKGTDPRSDLAIIKIDAKHLPYAQLGNSDLVQTGEWAVAIGNPFGFAVNNPKPTVTVGVISALHRQLPGMFGSRGTERDYLDLIQTDAAINPGNSGGPLCDLNGKIIGINVAIVSTTGGYQGVGFAIPSNIANNVIGDLIKGKKIVYGWFGVTVQDVTEDLAKFFGLPEKQGALVSGILKNSPAQKAGIKEGDIIISIDGTKIKTVRDVLSVVGAKKPGDTVTVTVFRDKKGTIIPVVVGERPGETKEIQETEKPEVKEDIVWRGIKVTDITPDIAQSQNIQDAAGVIITDVDPASPAAEAGLNQGDVIREINKTPVKNKSEYNKTVKDLKGDALVRTDKGYVILKEKAETAGD